MSQCRSQTAINRGKMTDSETMLGVGWHFYASFMWTSTEKEKATLNDNNILNSTDHFG